MSEKYIEKAFLYFILLSIVVHAAGVYLLIHFKEEKKEPKQEAFMVDLSEIPALKQQPEIRPRVRRMGEQRRRVAKETAPRGDMPRDRVASIPRPQAPAGAARAQRSRVSVERRPEPADRPAPMAESGQKAVPSKPAGKKMPELSQLYPSASRLAKLEEGYRKKYEYDMEDGDTRSLNSDDIYFGSFLKRFENAVYGVWRYPEAAARAGISGMTPVRITFNRQGEIEKIDLLESSGSQILDKEVFRTLKALGPIGGFPKSYNKEHFYLIAFFNYGISQGAARSLR